MIELKSVTVANTLQLARSFKEMSGFYILVLTSDYKRIDFILLEKVVPIGKKKVTVTQTPRFTLRPRILTVNRSDLDNVSRRVLRRFTFTEDDEYAQYDKIKSAYAIVDWGEDFFNNRALFSDYYLINRLKEDPIWKEKAETAYLFFKNNLKPISSQWHNVEENKFHNDFIEPVLEQFGFNYERVSESSTDDVSPHYILKSKNEGGKIGAMLCYIWGRQLDAKDYTRDNVRPEENPSQAVVTVLERGDVPWVIVTNGKIWRLYSAEAHSRATNYYEIDLEETIALDDPSEAFRYFWLLFREDAFVPRSYTIEGEEKKISFLDKLLHDSLKFSKELEERLKDRVFDEVFPYFAEGFIHNIGGKEKVLSLSEEERDKICGDVFSATLTILYRLLFLLYAESRNLLPVKEVRGYYEKSFTHLKNEIAKKANNNADDVETKLKQKYSKSDTKLYEYLLELAEIIDNGKSSINVPQYNGGLFLTQPREDDKSREAEISRFLLKYKIPDFYLAVGLDKLTRDEEPKRYKLVFLDYKSLGVRQLGSIYEGLLEFNVKIAPEKMAVVKEKNIEQVISYKEAVEKKKKILTIGRGNDKTEIIYPKGTFYIVGNNEERKVSGSYYTPDYIVKYIVKNTVGPILEKKFNEIRPKLRQLRPEQIESEIAKRLIDEFFDIHVLDPAMGSAHFLVEAVDFITDKMLDFLNGFPNNPIQVDLQNTRETIMDEMNKQGVTIDQNKLVDVSLMKRHVLKRCVYGVDLNPMAVELSKLSLWLDCFTLGAPLSFLDHHLKCGNSLIGASLKEAEQEIETGQMTIWAESKFGGVKSATKHMVHVGELSDITSEMVKESKAEYKAAVKDIEPYKEMLDIYTSRWFSNKPNVTKVGRKIKKTDHGLEFLRSKEIVNWLKKISNTQMLNCNQYNIIKNTTNDYWNIRFFHWELEFPEIFHIKDKKKGFDAIIGNPPYVSTKKIPKDFRDLFWEKYENYLSEEMDYYELFLLNMGNYLKARGLLGFICPNTFYTATSFSLLREEFLLKKFRINKIVDFPYRFFPFPDVNKETCILIISEDINSFSDEFPTYSIIKEKIQRSPCIDNRFYKGCLSHKRIESRPKNLIFLSENRVTRKMELNGRPLENITNSHKGWMSIPKSTKIGDRIYKKEIFTKDDFDNDKDLRDLCSPCVRGDDIHKYYFCNEVGETTQVYVNADEMSSETKSWHFNQKIILQRITGQNIERFIATFDKNGQYVAHPSTNLININPKSNYSLYYILAFLNTRILNSFYKTLFGESNTNITTEVINFLPIPHIFFETTRDKRISELNSLKDQYRSMLNNSNKNIPLSNFFNNFNFINNDVTHDFLEYLVEQMLIITRKSKSEIFRYLRWLEKYLGVKSDNEGKGGIDVFDGRTKIKNFIGDYRKEESHLEFDEFFNLLLNNRGRFLTNLNRDDIKEKIRFEYNKSLENLLSYKKILSKTDWLIEQIVYKLYGLTKNEIEIVKNSSGEK